MSHFTQVLSEIFQENGDLKDEFRRYPFPDDELSERTQYADKTLYGDVKQRVDNWEKFNLGRIPDWEKVFSHIETRMGKPEFTVGNHYIIYHNDRYEDLWLYKETEKTFFFQFVIRNEEHIIVLKSRVSFTEDLGPYRPTPKN